MPCGFWRRSGGIKAQKKKNMWKHIRHKARSGYLPFLQSDKRSTTSMPLLFIFLSSFFNFHFAMALLPKQAPGFVFKGMYSE